MAEDTVERIVLVDGYWVRDPNAQPGQSAGGTLAVKGSRVQVTQEEADRAAGSLGEPEEYQTLLDQEPAAIVENTSTPAVATPTSLDTSASSSDEAIRAMTVAEITAFLNQAGNNPEVLEKIETLENERENPRVGVMQQIKTIRASLPEIEPAE